MAKMKHIPANTPPDTGPKPASESLSVTIASSGPGQPVDATIVSPLGTQLAADSVSVTLASDSGTLPVDVQSSVLPTGAATEAKQDDEITALGTANSSLSSIATNTSNTVTAVQSIDTKTPALGQAAMVASVPVAIATDQSDVPVAISGTLPLPTGAATEAKQDDEITLLTSLDNKTTVVDTDNVTVVSSVLPTGAATEATLSSLDGKVVTCDTSDVTVSSSVLPTGAATEATLSSLDSKFTYSYVTSVRNVYSSVNITTGSWVELVASLPSNVSILDIFDSSGQTLELGEGASSSEARVLVIYPGGNGRVTLNIASGQRVSIRAISGTADDGELDINFLG